MDDLISRQAAIKAADSIIERDTSGNNDVVKAMTAWKEYIKALPSAQRWIPCSERLPEDGRYLCDYGGCIDFGRMTNGKWYVDGVIAWMPLPKPYREGGQDEQ